MALSDLHYRQHDDPEHGDAPVLVALPSPAQQLTGLKEVVEQLGKTLTVAIERTTNPHEKLLRQMFADHHRMMGEMTRLMQAMERRLQSLEDPVIHVPVPEVHPEIDVVPGEVRVLPAQRETLTVERDDRGFITRIVKEPA